MSADDLEDRLRKLERIVLSEGRVIEEQQREIARLRGEVSGVIADVAIQSLTPWPVRGRQGDVVRVTCQREL